MAQDLAALAAKMGGVSSPTGIDFAKLAQQNGGTSTAPTASGSPSSAPASFSVNPDGTIALPSSAGGSQAPSTPAPSSAYSVNPDGTIALPSGGAGAPTIPQTPPSKYGGNPNIFGQGNGNLAESILKNTIGSNGLGGLVGRPISSAITAGAETSVANSKTQLAQVTNAVIKKINSLDPSDPKRATLMELVQENQKAMGISDDTMNALEGNQETQEQNLGIAANSAATLAMGAASPVTTAGKIGLNAAIGGLSGGGTAAVNNESAGNVAASTVFGAATGALVAGVAHLGGKVLSTVPTRLYSQFFKTTTDEFAQGMTSDAATLLQKNDPAAFQSFVDKGVIKLNDDGTVQVSTSVAKKALQAGIAGSPQAMGAQVAAKTMSIETQVESAASKAPPVKMSTWQINSTINMLQAFRDTISSAVGKGGGGVFANDLTDPIDQALNTLKASTDGSIPASDALSIRRMLDAMQTTKAYVPDANLTISNSILKEAANQWRSAVNSIPEMGPLMKQYSSYMDMLIDLQKRGAQLQNSKVFNLFDLMAITEGAQTLGTGSSKFGWGVILDATLRAPTTPMGGTYLAQGINKVGQALSSPVGDAASTIAQRGAALTIPKAGLGTYNPPQ